MELFNYCFVIYVTPLHCQDTLYQELQCVLPTKYSSRWVFVRFPSVFCSFNNSKSVKLKFIEFVRLKAFFQVVHFICSPTILPPRSLHIQNTAIKSASSWWTGQDNRDGRGNEFRIFAGKHFVSGAFERTQQIHKCTWSQEKAKVTSFIFENGNLERILILERNSFLQITKSNSL